MKALQHLRALPKEKQISYFLKAVPYLNTIGNKALIRIAESFNITPETMALLIHIANETGGYWEN